ncbi:MAG: hypothetical protein HYV67_04180 [Candidatus Taylorbacteria bacterium]|nr:hypothetical protein [Candidatus Taylorbacteria bacterium]
MRHINAILGIGIALVLIPLLGFPAAWKNFLLVVLGLWLCGIVVSLRYPRLFGGKAAEREGKRQAPAAPSVGNKTASDSGERTESIDSAKTNHEQIPTV